jgi:metallo-beta-lactamase class B
VVYALTTSAGIIPIDSGHANEVETVLIAQMKAVGLDPAQVRTIVLTHGHGDHFGGAAYFQDHYGTRIVESAADWDMMQHTLRPSLLASMQRKARPSAGDAAAERHRGCGRNSHCSRRQEDYPGHDSGSYAGLNGLIFPVKDGAKNHVAGVRTTMPNF